MAYGKESQKDNFLFVHNGMHVCSMAWYIIHGISKTTFYRYKRRFIAGGKCVTHGNSAIIRKGHEHVEMGKALIQYFVEKKCKKNPCVLCCGFGLWIWAFPFFESLKSML